MTATLNHTDGSRVTRAQDLQVMWRNVMPAVDGTRETIEQLTQEWAGAELRGDTDFLSRNLADEGPVGEPVRVGRPAL